MKRLARLLPLVMILLLIGATVNIAMAWALAPAEVPNRTQSFLPRTGDQQWWRKDGTASTWPRATPQRWPAPSWATVYRRVGATHRRWTGGSQPFHNENEITVTSVGWPARSLAYEEWREYRSPGGTAQPDGHPQGPFRLGIPWRGGPKRLPLAPIPAGFAINTLFYSALAAGAWLSARRIRSAIRSRRGLCPHCAYARAGIPAQATCPECGKPEV